MHWRVKEAIRHALLALPAGERVYRWVTCEVLGTNAGMATKWLRVFPTHVQVLQEAFGAEARAQCLWCLDSGATIGAGLAMALVSDGPGLLTDRHDRLSDRYCACSRQVLAERGPWLAELSQAPADRLNRLLTLTAGTDARTALHAIGMTYHAGHEVAGDGPWRGTVGGVVSAGTLEHYTPEALEVEVARMARAVKPGGVLSHVVDHRDHRWHADKRLHPLAHLWLEEDAYRRQFGNGLDYHNRWLRSDYVALFTRHGFRVTCYTRHPYPDTLPPLDPATLATPFRGVREDDWRSLVTHFVAVRV